ncbi:MAG: dockerin type I repeat-containing protein [Candidatus Zixiibacteriota bacterium]
MILRKYLFLILLIIMAFSISYSNNFKPNVKIEKLSDQNIKNYLIAPHFSTAEYCTTQNYDSVAWAVTHWVIGNELYKAYQDPSESCENPYPYSVENVYITLYFEKACSLLVSVDIESADFTIPTCPAPGALLNLSSTYMITIPGPGLYQIETPLDSNCLVNEPYFVGFFFASIVDTTWNVSLVTDDTPVACVNYNIWDTAIGFVDLSNTGFPEFPTFPGRILLFSGGYPGGSGGPDPVPSVTILQPKSNDDVTGLGEVWASENSGNENILSAFFQYRSIVGNWTTMTTDFDGSCFFRSNIDPPGGGVGWYHQWNYSGLSEGTYWVKVTVSDDLGQLDVDSVQVDIDPTPPNPTLINPIPLANICAPITLQAESNDENISSVKFEKLSASIDYEIPLSLLGETNFGNYYCGPITAAMAIKYWFDQGYIFSMREGSTYIPIDTVVDRLADNMLTKINHGTYDDLFFNGLQQYNALHNNALKFEVYRSPDYHLYRTLLQERGELPILGLSGTTGLFVVGCGVTGLADIDDQYAIKIADPITGIIVDALMRNNPTGSEIYYDNKWYQVDIIFTIRGNNHYVTRDLIGYGAVSGNLWSYDWTSTDLSEDSLYFITTTFTDLSGRVESATSLVQYQCIPDYLKGDYNNDGTTNIGDVLYLSEFIYKSGPEPFGGAGRADANCNGSIDIADVIFMIKFIFEGGTDPCY